MLTAYDYPTAALIDAAGADIILVGDSLAQVVLGLSSTKEVGMDEMVHHAKAAGRAVKNALLIGDMPYVSYQENPEQAAGNAKRFIEEAGCGAVKLEWFDQCLEVTAAIVKAGIPLMGHVGLTPQTADKLGGYKVQGRDAESAQKIIERAKALEAKGCFAVVLECIPSEVAKIISEHLTIPTIGIGAGVHCDGQVLVINDLLGLDSRFHPKFAKQYADLASAIDKAVRQYIKEVKSGRFPSAGESYSIKSEELEKLNQQTDNKASGRTVK